MSRSPVVLCVLDGVGWGRRDDGDAVHLANTPHLDALMADHPWCLLQAHGTAVGMPSDEDMGNSEVGHNAMGAGRVFDQGAKLVELAIDDGSIWASPTWQEAVKGRTLHLIGLLSDGNVHSHINHLHAMIAQAESEGVSRLRVHVLTDGRDVSGRSALTYLAPLEAQLAAAAGDYAIATGGGRMLITMDRYEADWSMVKRGWDCHVHAEGRRFPTASTAVATAYADDPEVDDQWLPPFVVGDFDGIHDGDSVLFINFRGDRAVQISRAFGEPGFDAFARGRTPQVFFGGMMEYDGDLKVPLHTLVPPPAIDGTVGEAMSAAGLSVLATSETQKFGHVTFFFNGNRSEPLPGETRAEVRSDVLPFDQAPAMKAREVTEIVCAALRKGGTDHIRTNIANGDMVGHTGKLGPTIEAMEVVDACVGRIAAAAQEAGAILLVTADHGNADEMFQVDKKTGAHKLIDGQRVPSTSHSLNPVPFILVDPQRHWTLTTTEGQAGGGLAQIGGTLLHLSGLSLPEAYLPSLAKKEVKP